MNPPDPYRAPLAPPRVQSVRAPGEAVKWVYLVVIGAHFLLTMVLVFDMRILKMPASAHVAVESMVNVLRWGKLLAGPLWVYWAWSGIPRRFWGDLNPSRAAGRLLIPLYNLVWMFVVHVRLCVALDEALVDARRRSRAPRTWATAAPAVHLLASFIGICLSRDSWATTFVAATASEAVWLGYMQACDPLRREIVEANRQG